MRFVTLNSTKYGGGGGTYAVYAGNDPSSTEIALHELGHSFAHLGDQYDYGDSGNYSGSEPSEPDVTKFSSGDKWSEWLGYDQPGVGVIGAYEGARYYETGLYRPSENSKMRSLGQPFDAIGREAFIQRIYQYVRPIDAALATENPVSSSATLWADVVDPLVIQTQWYVDDQLIAGATGPYFVPADYGFGSGTHTVTLSAWDNTDWVRRGTEALQEQRQWIIGADLVTPGLVFSSSAEHLDLTEGGNALQYQFRLSAAPTQPVTIVIDGNGELDVSPSTIEFTPDNWNVSRTLTVSALSDEIVDGDDVGELVYRLESLDANYSALAVPQTRATVRDGTVAPPLNHAPQTQPVTLDVDSAWVDGTHVGTLTAFDSDPGQELTWAIVSGNETGLWTLDPATGALTLADASQLNPDGQPELILNVAVTDNGTPALTANAVVTLRIHDATHNPAIVLELHTFELEYRNRGSAAILDAQATVQTFGGNADLQGTKLQVRSTGRRAGKDRFVIVPGGGSNSGIAVDGSHISYQGIQIGTVIATRPKDGLQISLNSAANAVSVQALLRRVAFQTTAKKRVTRILELQLVGYHGADSEPHQIVVQTNLG